ncbi:GNAT family N-acetyltransferase [Actinoplanes utahensis]|uniref:Acetyltransferase n=1 Tax=Actinoplanes utahensis TaxID=1869 RepID=A0A0A6UKZ7_ACTUT|nr:GNAT family N-acetyltransferase [Actinoplanes utahensis]KHD76121.1 acetyltransferase [Actinoplanes utahensis]GIF28624.1 N-acetyltransferase [Actinoplanes utahensis]
MTDQPVRENTAEHRFELVVDGRVGALATYRLRDGAVQILHTETDPELRGRGLAGELARQTLDRIRSRGDRVIPSCPFFAHFISEHPEYGDLVAH